MIDYGDVSKALFHRMEAALEQLQKAWEYWQQHPYDADAARIAHTYADQAQDIAAQTVAAHIAQEQYVVAYGISRPAPSWEYPIPVGAWNGLTPDRVQKAYIAAHKGNLYAAQEDWMANHQQGVVV